ncbi:MAG: MaoC family dehydratase N-terminal domain-containing protein [Dehalococcoidia bacterium]|nr:MaoC family dehydratase N-terminal domain-containing protein [Dehalococcoidia bacterium]
MTEPEESLITDEHRAVVGVKSDPVEVTVKEEDAKRMRDLLGDDDPRYADGTGIAPPYVLAGLGVRPNRNLMPQILPNGLLTQIEWRFYKPIKIGSVLRGVNSVIDIRERFGGRYGYSILVMAQTEYLDEQDEPVAASLQTITQFDPKGAQS